MCETNTQFTEARALYTRHGYEATGPYEGHGKADHWYVKVLAVMDGVIEIESAPPT